MLNAEMNMEISQPVGVICLHQDKEKNNAGVHNRCVTHNRLPNLADCRLLINQSPESDHSHQNNVYLYESNKTIASRGNDFFARTSRKAAKGGK
jgi:hypothetical protein